MATGHILPGYGDPVRRTKSAFQLDRSAHGSPSTHSLVSRGELTRIKDEARRMWTPTERQETTYGHNFRHKPFDAKSLCRPSSPTRRNNPHPQPVFLMNRLHYIPGYHNADATMGKSVYQIDASLPPRVQALRREPREKFRARPSTTSVNQYRQKHNFREFMDPVEAQAMEAWMALADERDKDKMLTMFSDDVPASQRNLEAVEERCRAVSPSAHHPLASLHRYLRPAGLSEATELSRVMDTIRSNPARRPHYGAHCPEVTLMQLRDEDIEATGRVHVKRRPARGDFCIHPEWPPYMHHHRIPGF